MNENSRSRKWQLTINNPLQHSMTHEEIKVNLSKFKNCIYWCMCDETGENGTYHTHIYFQCSECTRFQTVKKRFSAAHIEYVKGTAQENRDYIRKEGKYLGTAKAETNHPDTFEEYGVMPVERGYKKENDFADLFDMIKDGMSLYEIVKECPQYLLQTDKLERAILMIRQESAKTTWRDLDVTYIWGPTGTGKTRYVMETFGYDKVYRVTDYDHPFDSYQGQDIVCFEEFRSSLRIEDMLKYLDGYPVEFPARYSNKQALFHKVYIVSNIDLKDQYYLIQDSQEFTWKAFLRRIHKVCFMPEFGVRKEYLTSDYMADGFSPLYGDSPFDDHKEKSEQIRLDFGKVDK